MILVMLGSSFLLFVLLCFFYKSNKKTLKSCVNFWKRLPCCRACGCGYSQVNRRSVDDEESRPRTRTGTFDSTSSSSDESEEIEISSPVVVAKDASGL